MNRLNYSGFVWLFFTDEESKRPSLDTRQPESREPRPSFGGSSRGYDRGGRRDDRDRDRDRDHDRGYESRYPRRDRGVYALSYARFFS